MFRWIDTIFPRRVLFQRDRRLLHLFLGRVLASVGFSIVIPFLSLYLHGTRGVPMSMVGGVFFIAALAGAVGQIVGGELSDRRGRKFVLICSQLVRAVAFFGLGFAGSLRGVRGPDLGERVRGPDVRASLRRHGRGHRRRVAPRRVLRRDPDRRKPGLGPGAGARRVSRGPLLLDAIPHRGVRAPLGCGRDGAEGGGDVPAAPAPRPRHNHAGGRRRDAE